MNYEKTFFIDICIVVTNPEEFYEQALAHAVTHKRMTLGEANKVLKDSEGYINVKACVKFLYNVDSYRGSYTDNFKVV
jgi:hypothetical protein